MLERVIAAGQGAELGFAGHFALDACRLEMGYRHWGHDMGPEDTPFEAGLGFAVRLDGGGEFIGREATLRRIEEGPRTKMICLEVEAGDADCHGGEAVIRNGDVVGMTTSGGYGHRTGASYAFAFVRPDLAAAGTEFDVVILDEPRCGRVLAAPAYDPSNERLKS